MANAPKRSDPTASTEQVQTRKADPLNAKSYAAVTVMLTVADVEKAAAFYQKAFGFEPRGVMTGPAAAGTGVTKAIHAEVTLRGTHIMLTPADHGARTARDIGRSAVTLYLLVEDIDKTIANAVEAGALKVGEVRDLFFGARRAHVIDPDGHDWMIATHVADYSLEQLAGINIGFQGGAVASGFPTERDAGDPPPFQPGVL